MSIHGSQASVGFHAPGPAWGRDGDRVMAHWPFIQNFQKLPNREALILQHHSYSSMLQSEEVLVWMGTYQAGEQHQRGVSGITAVGGLKQFLRFRYLCPPISPDWALWRLVYVTWYLWEEPNPDFNSSNSLSISPLGVEDPQLSKTSSTTQPDTLAVI